MTTANNHKPDVAAILSDLREQIRERHARLTVDGATDPHAHALNLAELRRSVESVNDTWFVSAHLPITWETRVLGRLNPEAPQDILLVLDATTGQNALAQVEVFRESAGVTGLIMTKLDGTARGGILVAAAEKFGLPIHAIGVGETADDLRPFDPRAVARAIAGLPPE